MNIFFISLCQKLAAQWMCDKHVVKMVLEAVQLLYGCWHLNKNDLPFDHDQLKVYKLSHKGHPMMHWVRECQENYFWTLDLAYAIADEYTYRYGKVHACVAHLDRLKKFGYPTQEVFEDIKPTKKRKREVKERLFATNGIPKKCTPYPLCFGENGDVYIVKDGDQIFGIESYQRYYQSKLPMMAYTKREVPDFLNANFEETVNKKGVRVYKYLDVL